MSEKKELTRQEGSSYGFNTVKINLNMYDPNGIGIPEKQYYCIDKNGNFFLKRKSIAGSIFHEFTHCLHEIEDAKEYETYVNSGSMFGNSTESESWTTNEELRTIAGYYYKIHTDKKAYDPICDNSFSFYESISEKAKYFPRLGHIGYVEGKVEYPNKKLTEFYEAAKLYLAWPERYLLP